MAQQETYYYGQGKVKLATLENGKLGAWRWVGDVSALSIALEIEKIEHKESYSGQKALVRSFPIGKTSTIKATLNSLSPENLALCLYGTPLNSDAGQTTAEILPADLQVGDIVTLANPGVSDLVITDSAGTPKTLAAEHYALDAAYGSVEILSLPASPALTQPFKAAYSYAASKQVSIFTSPQPLVALRYEGVNLAEGGAPIIVELYKVATDPLQELALISDGNGIAGMEISGGVLLDGSKSASGTLGQFGRIIQLV